MEMLQPDDMHHHFRDGDVLKQTVPAAARQFARVLAMPNLKPPVTTTEMALKYYDRLMAHAPENSNFKPLMTLYMTDKTPPEEIVKAKESGNWPLSDKIYLMIGRFYFNIVASQLNDCFSYSIN